jgi:hypothetical protein
MQSTHISVIFTSNGIPQILHLGSLIHLISFQQREHIPSESTISPQMQHIVGKQMFDTFEIKYLIKASNGVLQLPFWC